MERKKQILKMKKCDIQMTSNGIIISKNVAKDVKIVEFKDRFEMVIDPLLSSPEKFTVGYETGDLSFVGTIKVK